MTGFTRRRVGIMVFATLLVLAGGLYSAWAQNQTYNNGTVLYFKDNSGSMGSSMFVYGDSANRLLLGAGNTTRVTITPQGNVGIGTMTPGNNRLEIVGGNQVMGNNSVIYFRDNTGAMTNSMFIVGDSSNRISIGAGNASRLTIASGGNIGVGTTSPAARFHVAGDAQVDGNIAAKYQDVAEWVKAPTALKPGTVVVIDAHDQNRVLQAAEPYDVRVAGVVSERPGILLGEAGSDKIKVAQSGRVKVKVDATFGPVTAGDLLVTSPNPGHAMRSTPIEIGGAVIHRPGTLLGKALESLPDGQGEILVLITLQ